jgi:hypothetical protein
MIRFLDEIKLRRNAVPNGLDSSANAACAGQRLAGGTVKMRKTAGTSCDGVRHNLPDFLTGPTSDQEDPMIELHPVEQDPVALKQVYGSFPSGVTAVCAYLDGGPVGIAASSFTSVSIDPPLVSLCVQRSSTTWPTLSCAPRLGVSVRGETHDVACRQIAARTGDRFAGIRWDRTEDGAYS